MTPRITVYVASHNYGRFLEEAIESVLRQSVDGWELLLVDDGSTDNTPDVVRMYAGDPRVRTFRTEGIGLPAVCNLALREAQGQYLVRLDGDDVLDEDLLLVLAHRLDADPELALVFPDYYLMDENGHVFSLERRERDGLSSSLDDVPPNGACTMIRKTVLEAVGGYREDLGSQDGFDLFSKIRGRHRVGNVNLPLFYYRRHGQNLTSKRHRILESRRQIKKDASHPLLDACRPVTAVIPCRHNYDFCPDLWNRRICGVSLLERAIAQCTASKAFDHIVVTADDAAGGVRERVEARGDPRLRFVERPTSQTYRSVSIVNTLEHIIRTLELADDGVMLLAYIETPFKTTATLEEVLDTMVMNGTGSATAVEEIHDMILRRGAGGIESVRTPGFIGSDVGRLYRESSTVLVTRNRNVLNGNLIGDDVSNLVVPPEETFFISSEQQLEIANILDARQP